MEWFIFVFLSILFNFTPSLKGLYFSHDFYGVQTIIFLLFIIFLVHIYFKKETTWIKSSAVIFLLPLCFILSFPFAQSPKGSLDSILRWMVYSSFFVMLYWAAAKSKIQTLLPVVFQVTGLGIAFSMFLFNDQLIPFIDATVAGRFAGVFQYPNTFAMVMAVFFLFSLMMLTKGNLSRRDYLLYSLPVTACLTNIILSFSKGIGILLPMVWLVGLFLLDLKKQVKFLLATILSIPFTVISVIVLQTDNKIDLLVSIGMCVLYSGCLSWLLKGLFNDKISGFFNRVGRKGYVPFLIPGIAVMFSILFMLDMMNQGMVYQAFPTSVQQQVSQISMDTGTAKERMILASDSLKLIQEAPLLGHGGEAWSSIYQTYQSLPYQSKQIHNGYLDWGVSNGLVGIILFLFVWSYFYFGVIKHARMNRENTIPKAALLATLLFFVHSVIDFNFSYGTVWFLILWLFVIGLANEENKIKNDHSRNLVAKGFIAISAVIVMGCMLMSFRSMLAYDYFQQEQSEQVLGEKEKRIEKAISLDRHHLDYWFEWGEINAYQVYELSQKDQKNEVENVTEQVVKLEPENPIVYFRSGLLMEKVGDHSKAIEYYEQSLELDHFNAVLYERLADLKLERALQVQDKKESELLLDEVISYYEKNVDWYEVYEKDKPLNSKEAFNSRDFHIRYSTKLYAAKANFYKKNYLQTIYLLKNGESDDFQELTEGLAFQYVAYQRVGKQNIAENLMESYQADSQLLKKQVEEIQAKN